MKGFSVEPGVSRGSSDQKTHCSSANIPEAGLSLTAGNASLRAPQWPAKSPSLLGAHDPTNTKKVCVLLSSEAQFFSTSGKGEREFIADAGVSLFSLLAMHRAAQSSGYTLEFVTFSGSPPPVASFGTLEDLRLFLSKEKEECADLLLQQLQRPQQLRKATAADYCCLLLPHHLGAAIDLYSSSNTGTLIKEFGALNKPVGAVGYGAFALCAKPLTESESFPLAGRLVSTVPLAEEARYPYFGLLPFHLELHFAAEGARIAAGPTGAPALVVDGQLVSTGAERSEVAHWKLKMKEKRRADRQAETAEDLKGQARRQGAPGALAAFSANAVEEPGDSPATAASDAFVGTAKWSKPAKPSETEVVTVPQREEKTLALATEAANA